jgi:RimJ/RimL family protein N-acetyltransferase
LRLRGIRGSDFDDYAALHADPEVTRYLLGSETWDRGRAWRHMAFAVGLVWQRDHVISLINPKNLPSMRVAERIGERLEARVEHFGRLMLRYGLDQATYLREVAPAHLTVRCAG